MSVLEILRLQKENNRWLDENLSQLVKKYNGKYVAVWQKDIITASDSIAQIHEKLKKSPDLPPKEEVTIRYIAQESQGMLI